MNQQTNPSTDIRIGGGDDDVVTMLCLCGW